MEEESLRWKNGFWISSPWTDYYTITVRVYVTAVTLKDRQTQQTEIYSNTSTAVQPNVNLECRFQIKIS